MNAELRKDLVDVFTKTGRAHHAAFAATDGVDPEWPIWYAERLQKPMTRALQTPFSKSQLVYCVMNADFEHLARAPESNWTEYYADQFIEHYAASLTPAQDKLVLYYSRSCPFCTMVTSAIGRLGLDVELRDVFAESRFRSELVEVRGRATVPVLRITSADGEDRWMPESRDIVRYLETLTER
jgi:glutaredoxin